ncbi:hypothetical protein NADFUDRAFT_41990 [Nadsonia fulvescens var. elongata DSM 6958]|uniref:Uncharacterized protein n=1 Tax=Nadsonia fulvescens var. elongata DSM 6958 TaxID=857566 RepID=A0A1E3PKR5_9ASCO|nr:hypothetical protein NADFUDRAFT_41990 [Nadsonia fulvescens var. elongata DSM 6958]
MNNYRSLDEGYTGTMSFYKNTIQCIYTDDELGFENNKEKKAEIFEKIKNEKEPKEEVYVRDQKEPFRNTSNIQPQISKCKLKIFESSDIQNQQSGLNQNNKTYEKVQYCSEQLAAGDSSEPLYRFIPTARINRDDPIYQNIADESPPRLRRKVVVLLRKSATDLTQSLSKAHLRLKSKVDEIKKNQPDDRFGFRNKCQVPTKVHDKDYNSETDESNSSVYDTPVSLKETTVKKLKSGIRSMRSIFSSSRS